MQAQENAPHIDVDLTSLTDAVQKLFTTASNPEELATFRDAVLEKAVLVEAASRIEELTQGATISPQ